MNTKALKEVAIFWVVVAIPLSLAGIAAWSEEAAKAFDVAAKIHFGKFHGKLNYE